MPKSPKLIFPRSKVSYEKKLKEQLNRLDNAIIQYNIDKIKVVCNNTFEFAPTILSIDNIPLNEFREATKEMIYSIYSTSKSQLNLN